MSRVAVVGKGLFGAAACRHLARAGLAPYIIGPDEPRMPQRHRGPFGAHYDEARILVARGNKAESALTWLSIDGMLDLEEATGQTFVTQSGALEVHAATAAPRAVRENEAVSVPIGATAVDEPPPQGYYNPRAYLRAALSDARHHGAHEVSAVVTGLETTNGWTLTMNGGATLNVDAVVIACGAWSNRLLRRRLEMRLKREYVLFAELAPGVAAEVRMRPTVFHGRTGAVETIYALPPVRYPDGASYLKLGANTLHDRAVADAEIDDWYRNGDSDEARPDLVAAFTTVFPELPVDGYHTEGCVITYTPHGRPFIDELDAPGLFVAAGGNGHGASWADGAGWLVAALVGGQDWGGGQEGLSREAFRAVYADQAPQWPRPLLLAERTD